MNGCPGLAAAVATVRYRAGWSFALHAGTTTASWPCGQEPGPAAAGTAVAGGTAIAVMWGEPMTLVICLEAEDSGEPGRTLRLAHPFWVPPAEPPCGWARWLLDRCLDVDRHEGMELFEVDGARPFYPAHGPDARLYDIAERPRAVPG